MKSLEHNILLHSVWSLSPLQMKMSNGNVGKNVLYGIVFSQEIFAVYMKFIQKCMYVCTCVCVCACLLACSCIYVLASLERKRDNDKKQNKTKQTPIKNKREQTACPVCHSLHRFINASTQLWMSQQRTPSNKSILFIYRHNLSYRCCLVNIWAIRPVRCREAGRRPYPTKTTRLIEQSSTQSSPPFKCDKGS